MTAARRSLNENRPPSGMPLSARNALAASIDATLNETRVMHEYRSFTTFRMLLPFAVSAGPSRLGTTPDG